ncbi:MAG: hypothetical protein AAF533_01010 [Acidobacteriota bacterium]
MCSARNILTLVTLTLLSSTPSMSQQHSTLPEPNGALELLTRARLESDLGRHRAAVEFFERVVESEHAAPALRAEALVLQGAAHLALGETAEGHRCQQRVLLEHGDQPEATWLLAFHVTSVAPRRADWTTAPGLELGLGTDEEGAESSWIIWPKALVPASAPGQRRVHGEGADTTLGFEGPPLIVDMISTELGDLLFVIADVQGWSLIIDPVRAAQEVTLQTEARPSDMLLDSVLRLFGLSGVVEDGTLRVGTAEELGLR